MPKGHAVVDGSNIATEGRSTPSLAQLDEAVTTFVKEHDFEYVTVIVDASFEHRVEGPETDAAREAIADGEIITPPAGVIGRGDAFILQVADRANAVVLSNDSFQEFHGTYDWLFDDGRLIGGKPIPGVGWIFVSRSPVRGPVSRRAVREATVDQSATAAPKAGAKKAARKTAKKTASTRAKAPSRAKASGSVALTAKTQNVPKSAKGSATGHDSAEKKGRVTKKTPGANSPAAWKSFKEDYPEGSTVAVSVERFSSHGAYGSVDGAAVYIPLRLLANPAPRRARDVIALGQVRDFVVHGFDERRKSIDVGIIALADPGDGTSSPATESTTKKAAAKKESPRKSKTTRKTTAKPAAPARKTPAKKMPAKKAAAKKAPAEKTPAKKARSRKPAPTKATPAKKTPAKKARSRKPAPTEATPAKKTAAKKAPAEKTPAKKTSARKATVPKTPARKRR